MKHENRRFLLIVSAMTAICCIIIVILNFASIPPVESTLDISVDSTSKTKTANSSSSSSNSSSAITSTTAQDSTSAPTSSSANNTQTVNINTADVTTLSGLPGIGSTIAQRIVDYRNAHGQFKSTNDLLNVSGIGDKKLQSFINQVTI